MELGFLIARLLGSPRSRRWKAAALFAVLLPEIGGSLAEEAVSTGRMAVPPAAATIASPRIAYGGFLFTSGLLSSDHTLACSSCHIAQFGLSGGTATAVGVNGTIGTRRAPPLFDLGRARDLMWDGRATSLFEQIHMPLEDVREMNINWHSSLALLDSQPATTRYLAATGELSISRTSVIGALAAYVESLVSRPSGFDRYYYQNDETAISDDAKDGFRIFLRKARCGSCHLVTGTSAPLTDYNFHAIGIGYGAGEYKDLGRYAITKDPADLGAFKTPSLRNVALRPYLMHDGSFSSLRAVIDYYNRGGNLGAANMDGRIHPLFLNETEVRQLLSFLETLTSEIVSVPQADTVEPQRHDKIQ